MENNNKQQGINKKVFEKIKTNFCVFVCKDANYDNISNYNDTNKANINTNSDKSDHLEKCMTPKLQTKSRTRLPMYYKTPTNTKNDKFIFVNKSRPIISNQQDYDDIENALCINEPLHSTKIDNNVESTSISKFPYLCMTSDIDSKFKATSTLINNILEPNYIDKQTPDLSEIKQTVASPSSCLATSSSSSSGSSESQVTVSQINNKLFNYYETGAIYSCFIQYNALYDGDLTIKFAERLQIIQDDCNYHVLVQNVSTKKFGYVPRDHIIPVNRFLETLF